MTGGCPGCRILSAGSRVSNVWASNAELWLLGIRSKLIMGLLYRSYYGAE